MGVLCWAVCCLTLLLPAATNSAIPRDASSSDLQPVQTSGGDRAPVAVQQGRGASLGCVFGDVTPEQAFVAGLEKPRGAHVSAVLPGGPADLAGLEIDDIVLEADRQGVTAAGTLAGIVRAKAPGESLPLTVLRERRTIELVVVLAASAAEAASGREGAFRACALLSCPACDKALVLLGRTAGDACSSCLKSLDRDIAACTARSMAPAGPAPPPAEVQPVLALEGLVLKPPRVAPGARFTIEVAYTASPDRPVTLAFSIRADDRELLASAPEVIASGAGTPMWYARSLVASPNPGEYRIRVRLEQDDRAVERTVALTVAPRRP